MRKIFILMILGLLSVAMYAQPTPGKRNDESNREYRARMRKEVKDKHYQDSLKYEETYLLNKWSRERWEEERRRRDSMTAEQLKELEDLILQEQQKEQQEKKVSKTGKGSLQWMTIFAGYNVSTKTGNDPNYDPVGGLIFGIHTQIFNLSDYLALGVGANFSMQGGKYESHEYVPGGTYGATSATSRLNYLNFPVLVHYQKQATGFFADAGIQPGILLSAKNKGGTTSDIKDEVKKFDVGIPIGAGYQFKNKLGIALRITPGLMNVNKDAQYKNRNMVASLRASYAL